MMLVTVITPWCCWKVAPFGRCPGTQSIQEFLFPPAGFHYALKKASEHFERKGYEATKEHPIKGNGAVDLVAERSGEKVAIEVETGKSDIDENLSKLKHGDFNRAVLLATCPSAVTACTRAVGNRPTNARPDTEVLTWLDIS